MRRRFFVERFEGGAALLRGEAAHHLGRVLRAEQGQLYELSDGVSLPVLVRNVKPVYTAQALAAHVQGVVLLSAVVLADGTVGEVTVVRSLDTQYGLDNSAVSAARQWLFNPGTKDGIAVAVRVSIEMSFTITG